MAAPRHKIFYDHVPLTSIPPGQEWMPAYESNSRKVIEYLAEKNAGSTAYHGAIRCLTELRDYLVKTQNQYSTVIAEQWYRNTGPYPKGYLSTLQRLQDFYESGEIRPLHSFPKALPYYSGLKGFWKEQLDHFLSSIENGYSHLHLVSIRNCIARFFYAVQEAGLKQPGEITFEFLDNYLANDALASVHAKNRYGHSISDIMIFMADSGLCEHGTAWYANAYVQGKLHRFSECQEGLRMQAESFREESQEFSSEQFAMLIPDFLEKLDKPGYSKPHRTVARATLYGLLVFLAMHQYGYHPCIAAVWLELEKQRFKSTGCNAQRRFLDLFEEYTLEGDFRAEKFFRKKPLKYNLLPRWCRETSDSYLRQREKEGWESSTLCMIRSSVTRFCEFLVRKGLSSFAGITPSLISEFNRQDPHLTVEGKNAYNIRIKKFLRFLEMNAVIPFGTSDALLCSAAATEKNVVTLSSEEVSEIANKADAAETPIELRDKAVLALGLEMGIRSIDIVGINLNDIDWARQSIRILQKKTSHEIRLPMPTSVGNAIYTYIKYGRPRSGSNALILSTKAPFGKASRAVCKAALCRALPKRNKPGSGFHVTRKTFATTRFQKNFGMDAIADMLGHRTRENLFQYLNLDSEKMRLCAIFLKDSCLEMEDGRYD